MLLYGRTQPLSHYPIAECLAALKRAGFDGVELCLENEDIAPATLDAKRVEEVSALIAEAGFTSHSVSYHKDYIYDDAMFEETLKCIELTPALGSDVFVFSGCRKREDSPDEWIRLVARTREMADIAEDNGVTLALEFEPGFAVGNTAEMLRLFGDVDSEKLCANLDLGHMFLEDPDPLAAIREVGDRIAHCHIENMARGVHHHLLPQEGDMDLGSYLAVLQEADFKGGVALDLYGVDYEAVSPAALSYIRNLVAKSA